MATKKDDDTKESLETMVASYKAYNNRMAETLKDIPVKTLDPIKGSYSVSCSVCHESGPAGETIFSGTMAAQQAGYTYDSESLKAGRKVTWFCPKHAPQKPETTKGKVR